VRFLLDRLLAEHGDLRRLANVQIATIGPRTADELRRYHLKADLAPNEYRAEALAVALEENAAGKSFLLARASRGREVLSEQLTASGAMITQVVVYESRDVPEPQQHVADALGAGKIDWITVTSSAIARSLHAMFGDELKKSKLASISPITSATLRELGHEPDIEATVYTTDGLIEVLLSAVAVED